jgi:hypothetical protein
VTRTGSRHWLRYRQCPRHLRHAVPRWDTSAHCAVRPGSR